MTVPSYHHLPTLGNVSVLTTLVEGQTGETTAKEFKWQDRNEEAAATDENVERDNVQLRAVNNVELPQGRAGGTRNKNDNNMAVVAYLKEGPGVHTQTLCVIRREHGMLISSPGFNEPERDGQNQTELSDQGQGMDSYEGPRMTAYLFQTPGGKQFRYTLELLLDGAPEYDLEPPDVRNRDSEQQIRAQKKLLYDSFLEEREEAAEEQVHVEIVAAKGFSHPNAVIRGSGLFVKYSIVDAQDPQRCLVRGCTGTNLPGNFGDGFRFMAVFLTSFTALCFVSRSRRAKEVRKQLPC